MKINEEVEAKMEEYFDTFKDSFPLMQICPDTSEELVEIIDKCVENGKDVYEMGYCKIDLIY